MSNWISVKDRLPNIGERVIIYTSSVGIVVEAVRYKGNYFDRFGVNCEATYWMPLPEPPKEKEQ